VVAWNAAFATIQLALAAGLLWRPAVKAALAGTVIWSVAVWWLGEGLGGLLTGTATPLTGAPGAVILYAVIALLVWPARPGDRQHATVAAGGALGSRWSSLPWLVLWGCSAYLVLQAPNRAPGGLRASLSGLAAGELHHPRPAIGRRRSIAVHDGGLYHGARRGSTGWEHAAAYVDAHSPSH